MENKADLIEQHIEHTSQEFEENLGEVIKLMIQVNKYSKKCFQKSMNLFEKGDKDKFETEIKYFKEWFKQNDIKLRHKFEYFWGPYETEGYMQ